MSAPIATVRKIVAGVATGALLLSAGFALTPLALSDGLLVLTMGVLTAAGAGAGSFSILIGIAAKAILPERRSVVAGFINAGGSIGQFIFSPLLQALIAPPGWGWAMLTMAVAAPGPLPLSWPLRPEAPPAPTRGLGSCWYRPPPHPPGLPFWRR